MGGILRYYGYARSLHRFSAFAGGFMELFDLRRVKYAADFAEDKPCLGERFVNFFLEAFEYISDGQDKRPHPIGG